MLKQEEETKEKMMKQIEQGMMQDRAEKQQDLKDKPCMGSKGNNLKFGAKIKKLDLPPPSR